MQKTYDAPMKTHLSESRDCTSKHHGVAVLQQFLHHLCRSVQVRVLSQYLQTPKQTHRTLARPAFLLFCIKRWYILYETSCAVIKPRHDTRPHAGVIHENMETDTHTRREG